MAELTRLLIISLIAALGYLVGIAQSWISPEEMKDGKRYFIIMRYLMIAVIAGIAAYSADYSLVGLALLMAAAVFYRIRHADYILAGVMLGLSSEPALTATAIFIYGFPAGSLLYKVKDRYVTVAVSMALMVISTMITTYFF